jgi:hypothetical protein
MHASSEDAEIEFKLEMRVHKSIRFRFELTKLGPTAQVGEGKEEKATFDLIRRCR